jgi:hypothetical protein
MFMLDLWQTAGQVRRNLLNTSKVMITIENFADLVWILEAAHKVALMS